MPKSTIHRAADFTLSQATKSIKRPSRLFLVSLSLFPRLAGFVLRMLPERWVKTPNGKASCFETGSHLFQRDRPAEAWEWLKRALHAGHPSIDECLLGAMCLYHGLGRFRDAMSLLTKANERGLAEADGLGLGNVSFRVLDSIWARHIGHTATLDYVIKLGILEGRHREETILYLPPGSPTANPFLLQQMAAHLRLVKDSVELPFDASTMLALHYDYLAPCLPDRTTDYFWEIAGKTYRRWQKEGRGPLLTLPPRYNRSWMGSTKWCRGSKGRVVRCAPCSRG